MGLNHDHNKDAHKLSNYKEWKETAHVVTDVKIDLASTGIRKKDLDLLVECVVNNVNFCLYGKTGFVIVLPEFMAVKLNGSLVRYEKPQQFSNALKLLLFNFNRVYVPPKPKIKLVSK